MERAASKAATHSAPAVLVVTPDTQLADGAVVDAGAGVRWPLGGGERSGSAVAVIAGPEPLSVQLSIDRH